MVELPEVIDAVTVVGMIVGPKDCFDIGNVGIEELLSKVGAGVDEDPGALVAHQDRHAPAPVLRF
jgi:hypothetical protein